MRSPNSILSKIYDTTIFYRKRDLELNIGRNGPEESNLARYTLSLSEIEVLKDMANQGKVDLSILYQAEDLFLRQRVEPIQSLLDSWIKGAKAQVNGHDVPFSEIITWCQEATNKTDREALMREARSLCRFLAPFSHSTWKALLECVEEELGYESYFRFCQAKKGAILSRYPGLALRFLDLSANMYFPMMDRWLGSMKQPLRLEESSRFDAIYLLGLRYLDHLFPKELKGAAGTKAVLALFEQLFPEWKNITVHTQGKKGRQSYCIPLRIPQEIHVIAGPIHGWLDLEALFHELGHAVFFANNAPGLRPEEKDYFQSAALSETFAFLFQLHSMSEPFLTKCFSVNRNVALLLEGVHKLKFLTLCRRYAAKAYIEYENFIHNRVSHGQDLYAKAMKRYTGFQYDPETYLFDLMPDFYSMDYFEAFLAAPCLAVFLQTSFGRNWFLEDGAHAMMRSWWTEGNRYGLDEFLKRISVTCPEGMFMSDFMQEINGTLFDNVKKMAQIV